MTWLDITRIDESLPVPSYQTLGSAGMDLMASIKGRFGSGGLTKLDSDHGFAVVYPSQIILIPAGFKMAIGEGFEGQVRPRSGLAIGKGLTVVNSPGTIDSDYRGEVMVGLINLSANPVVVEHGDRIAQLVINKFERVVVIEQSILSTTDRGEGGFGHTGK